jgi:hypothetical protein
MGLCVFAAIIKIDIAMEHTSTRCKIHNTRNNQKYLRSDFIHNNGGPHTKWSRSGIHIR